MDPTSALLAGAPSYTGGTAGPSMAYGGTQGGALFDSSGWSVAFGGGSVNTPHGMAQYLPYAIAALLALVVWKASKK
jgi:hypothetical protein